MHLGYMNNNVGMSAELEYIVQGTERIESCIGEAIMYTCTLPSQAHRWIVSGITLPDRGIVNQDSFDVFHSVFTLRVVSSQNGNITSELKVISIQQFNGTSFTCIDVSETSRNDFQRAVGLVLGELYCLALQLYVCMCGIE